MVGTAPYFYCVLVMHRFATQVGLQKDLCARGVEVLTNKKADGNKLCRVRVEREKERNSLEI